MKPAIFLERDGILNHARIQGTNQVSPRTLEDFLVNKEIREPLLRLKAAGFALIATTNQPGISRGYLSRRELDLMHSTLLRALPLDDLFMCPHDEMDRCPCRKPKPGLLREAAFKHHVNLQRSFVVSDKWQDAQAAHTAGSTSVLLQSPWIGKGHHDSVLPTFEEIVHKILLLHAHPPSLVSHGVGTTALFGGFSAAEPENVIEESCEGMEVPALEMESDGRAHL